jgi:hypothetical protein
MRVPPRHLDQRRTLTPRDYASPPDLFGVTKEARFLVPRGGDEVSMRIALEQHLLICEWEDGGRHPTAALLGRRFGINKQTLSLTARGRRWAGETVLAALVHATRRSTQRAGTQDPSEERL